MILESWKSQLRKGLLELCILNLLRQKDFYGYGLVQTLKRNEGVHLREGTIYPILARLQDQEFVESYTMASEDGPPRKYFRVTPKGITVAEEMNQHWDQMVAAMTAARTPSRENLP